MREGREKEYREATQRNALKDETILSDSLVIPSLMVLSYTVVMSNYETKQSNDLNFTSIAISPLVTLHK